MSLLYKAQIYSWTPDLSDDSGGLGRVYRVNPTWRYADPAQGTSSGTNAGPQTIDQSKRLLQGSKVANEEGATFLAWHHFSRYLPNSTPTGGSNVETFPAFVFWDFTNDVKICDFQPNSVGSYAGTNGWVFMPLGTWPAGDAVVGLKYEWWGVYESPNAYGYSLGAFVEYGRFT